jgi:hypothetical protein
MIIGNKLYSSVENVTSRAPFSPYLYQRYFSPWTVTTIRRVKDVIS